MKQIFIVFIFLILGAGIALALNASSQNALDKKEVRPMNNKVLVAYFSHSGNTKDIALEIQKQTGGDIFEIAPLKPYPRSYGEVVEVARVEVANGAAPKLKNNIDVSKYDVIFVGTPAWCNTMAPPVKTFLTTGAFEGKTIVPFISHGGGGGYDIAGDMKKAAAGSNVLKPLLVYYGGDYNTPKEIQNWLNRIVMPK